LRVLTHDGNGPDEFRVVPGLPLQAPESLETLPTPTPGGTNLSDPNPLADGIVALGGRPQVNTGVVPAGDASIVNHASRFGRDATIREQLAEVDAKFRKNRGRFGRIRLAPVDRYNKIYEPLSLDPDAEIRRWRRAGLATPSAPPEE